MSFQKATKKKVYLKLAMTGVSGSGKTYSALRLASGISDKIAFVDTENRSASLYSDKFNFDVMDISPPFNDDKFINAIIDAQNGGYEVLIIDSASHFWEGVLDVKEKMDARGGNSYTNWNKAGKIFKGVVDAVLQSKLHIICCMRSKQDYVIEQNSRGKQAPKKVGLAPVMRDGIEYEFTTVFDIAQDHNAEASKDRTGLFSGKIEMITEDTGKSLMHWRDGGEDLPDTTIIDLIRDNVKRVGNDTSLNACVEVIGDDFTFSKMTKLDQDQQKKVLTKLESL